MACRQQPIQSANAIGEFLAKINGIEIPYRNTAELNPAGRVVSLQRFPSHIDRTHVLVHLQIQYGSDVKFPLESVDVIDASRMRTDEEVGKNLRVSMPVPRKAVCLVGLDQAFEMLAER